MSVVLKVAKVAVGITFSWLLVVLAIETLIARRSPRGPIARGRWLERAYRRHPKTRPTVEFRTFRL
jgi:hypothetical protein